MVPSLSQWRDFFYLYQEFENLSFFLKKDEKWI